MLTCMNCDVTVDPDEGKVFAQVFVCPTCYAMAERLYQRGEQELKSLLILQLEAIRLALVEKRFYFSPDKADEPSKADVLRAIVELEEKRAQRHPTRH